MKAAAAGLAIILGTNAVAIGGALYNRSAADATLVLTQRELRQAWSSDREENSGLSLHLQTRALGPGEDSQAFDVFGYWNSRPGWLDGDKLRALGFDPPAKVPMGSDIFRTRNRVAYFVLELEGPAWQEAIKRTEQAAGASQAVADKDPASKEKAERARQLKQSLEAERSSRSRLFIIDGGTDDDALRAQYPDRAHYAIVRGHVSAYACSEDRAGLCGNIETDVPQLNVPLPMRASFAGAAFAYDDYPVPGARPRDDRPGFRATVSFGRRHEPWIVSAERD